MSMPDLIEDLERRAAEAVRAELGAVDGARIVPIERSTRDDLQTAAAMQLARSLRRKPAEIAGVIAGALSAHEAVDAASVVGPGFVNVRLRDAWLGAHVHDALAARQRGRGERVIVDYSSPNVAKPMHIAHIRSTIIGDAVKRSLRAVGYEVVADNHLGDWGTQFGKLIVAYRRWLDPEAFARAPVDELLRLYVRYAEEEERESGKKSDDEEDVKDAPPILQAARAELVALQRGDAENVALWRRFIEVSMSEFDVIYRRLGVSFDVVLGESFYNDRLEATVSRLVDAGIAELSEGAIAVFFSKERDGEALPPFLVRKADGGFNYGATDVAGILYRLERWQPARIIIVTDERQQLHFRQFFAAARRIGVTCGLEHVWFGLMRMPEGVISTRKGTGLISLDALLDEAERRAFEVATETNPELTEAERREVARVVGIGAVKYNDLCRDRQTMVTFTWDKALSLTGNSGPYLQYAFARIQSILRKARAEGAEPGPVAALEPAERALLLRLYDFAAAVERVAEEARPHFLCDYLFSLAMAFSTFYTECPVLKAEPAVRASRLTLCERTGAVLKEGLGLLGIEVLDRM